MSKCSICKKEIVEGEGRFNTPDGVKCLDCYDKRKADPKYTKIAGHNIPTKLLREYAEKVEYTRHSAISAKARDKPELVLRALQDRVEIHKKIFKITGHDHDSVEPEARKIREGLERWLEKNTLLPTQEHGLI